jgi:PAS domain S-box-containing protein
MRRDVQNFLAPPDPSALQALRSLLTAIVECSDDAVISETLDGRITSWNPTAEKMFGYSAAEAVGRSIRLIIPPERYSEEDLVLGQIARGEKIHHFETVRQTADGRLINVSLTVSPVRDAAGEVVRVSKIARDLTIQKRTEHEQARLSTIVESSDDAIVSKDLNGIIKTWNRAAERMFGYTAAEAVGRSIRLIIPTNRGVEEDYVLSQIRRGEKVDHFETVRQTKDGRLINVSVTISPIRDSDGQVIGASKVARDITLQKRVECERAELLIREQAARQELLRALAARDELLAVAAHELRNPLHVFSLTLSLLHRIAGQPAKTAQIPILIERARGHLSRLTALIDRLLDVTRIRAGGFDLYREAFDLGELVSTVVARFSGEHVPPILVNLEPGIRGTWDHLRIDQAVTNLIDNAVKYGDAQPISVCTYKTEREAFVAVRDQGVGIPGENLGRIFERFERLQGNGGDGWGLGLWITKRIAEAHSGSVAAESAAGKGSLFTIKLPL